MSRSGYSDDCEDNWQLIKWRGQVASAIRGKRGQAFLTELIEALDAMPVKRLIAHDLQQQNTPPFIPPQFSDCSVCAIGSVGIRRGVELKTIDPEDYDKIANTFGIAHQLVQEIEWVNDEGGSWRETPDERWKRVRAWAANLLKPKPNTDIS